MTSARAPVYHITGDDYLDDPARGNAPVRSGTLDEITTWLTAEPTLDVYALSVNGQPTVWAADFGIEAAAMGLSFNTIRSENIRRVN